MQDLSGEYPCALVPSSMSQNGPLLNDAGGSLPGSKSITVHELSFEQESALPLPVIQPVAVQVSWPRPSGAGPQPAGQPRDPAGKFGGVTVGSGGGAGQGHGWSLTPSAGGGRG